MKDYISKDNNIFLMNGDSAKRLEIIGTATIDAIVTDPPYFVAFMGKKWDRVKDRQDAIDKFLPIFKECLRVLKPGGHLLAFSLPRTSHYTACLLEDAGFELRDSIHWLFGSGFPKSHNIGLAVDKLNEVESKVVGTEKKGSSPLPGNHDGTWTDEQIDGTYTLKEAQNEWKGWGTALKPAHELIWLARKPLEEDTVAEQVLKTGTGGLNIDSCRVGTETITINGQGNDNLFHGNFSGKVAEPTHTGRFPANLILGCSCENPPEIEYIAKDDTQVGKALDTQERGWGYKKIIRNNISDKVSGTHQPDCVCAELDAQSGKLNKQGKCKTDNKSGIQNQYVGGKEVKPVERTLYLDSGGASRFFYCAKVSTSERNAGLETEKAAAIKGRDEGQDTRNVPHKKRPVKQQNTHPTVKPLKLMSYLITLITPPSGVVLDPFMGSGSTGIAAKQLGFKFIGIEREKEYFKIAKKRIK